MISFELADVRAGLGALVQDNEHDLAACAGHVFVALNSRLPNSNHACARCGGVVDADTAAAYVARAAA
jgi:hypothetical protein